MKQKTWWKSQSHHTKKKVWQFLGCIFVIYIYKSGDLFFSHFRPDLGGWKEFMGKMGKKGIMWKICKRWCLYLWQDFDVSVDTILNIFFQFKTLQLMMEKTCGLLQGSIFYLACHWDRNKGKNRWIDIGIKATQNRKFQ